MDYHHGGALHASRNKYFCSREALPEGKGGINFNGNFNERFSARCSHAILTSTQQ